MNILLKIFIVSILFTLPQSIKAQNNKKTTTVEFEVKGVCGMCKERIEDAGLIKGVKFLEWDQQSGLVKAVYKEGKITEKEIHEAIANVGHSTSQVKANKEAYDALPPCCAYEDGVTKH